MALYTTSYLRGVYTNERDVIQKAIVNESFSAESSYDIFLSHSFLDKDVVYGLYIELKSQGYTVYVDWIVDPDLDRNNITKQTAEFIRKRMRSCKSILVAISVNASYSKWIPWELGFMDGTTHRCAIIPISSESTVPKSYKGFEFLSLYPFIKKVPTRALDERLFVIEDAFKYVIFDNWIHNSLPVNQEVNIYDF